MPKVTGISPLNEFDLADQVRLHPTTFLHLLRSNGLSPSRRSVFGKISKRALIGFQFAKSAENVSLHSWQESVLYLGNKHQALARVNTYDQCIESAGAGDVTTNDKFLCLIRSIFDPGARALGRLVDGINALPDDPFQSELTDRLDNLSRRGLKLRRKP